MRVIFIFLVMLGFSGLSFGEAHSNEGLLRAHSDGFRKEVITVTEGIHVAVGYALANSILIEGDDGVIIVDTTENVSSATEILAEFRKITDKPVKAIIYTHFHADHIAGARVFAGEDNPQIIAHSTTEHLAEDSYRLLFPITFVRTSRQFGVFLNEEQHLSCGIGAALNIEGTDESGFLKPTLTVEDSLSTTIAGIRLELFHAPGETSDQINIWLPEKKVLLPGDNFYKAFPNLYAIRGTKYRDIREWSRSLDKAAALDAEYMVPSHTRPITGAAEIKTRLTNYSEAIRFIHDETVKGINRGMTPDELVEFVQLPQHLKEDPWLVEYYGTVAWSVRSVFAGYLGWFDGNPANLSPLSTTERAERVAKLAGGTEALLQAGQDALAEGDYQWALELSDWLRKLTPTDEAVKQLRTDALLAMGKQQISANGRNYYISTAVQGQ